MRYRRKYLTILFVLFIIVATLYVSYKCRKFGHVGNITCMAVSPDSKYLVTAGIEKRVILWELKKRRKIGTFEGHNAHVSAVSFSPDGKYVATGGSTIRVTSTSLFHKYKKGKQTYVPDASVRLWEKGSRCELRQFVGHSNKVASVVFSHDGKELLTGSWDKTIRLWDIDSGAAIRVFEGHDDYVIGAVFMPDGKRILSAGYDGTLRIWDLETGKELRTIIGHTGNIISMGLSPDGRLACSGSSTLKLEKGFWANVKDDTLRLWDLSSGKEIRRFEGLSVCITAVAFSPDGRYLAGANEDIRLDVEKNLLIPGHKNNICVWEVETGRKVFGFHTRGGGIPSLIFTRDGSHIITGSRDGAIEIWPFEKNEMKD